MSWQQPRVWPSMGNTLRVCVALCLLETLGACWEGLRVQLCRRAHLRVGGLWNLAHILLAQMCGVLHLAKSVPFLLLLKTPGP